MSSRREAGPSDRKGFRASRSGRHAKERQCRGGSPQLWFDTEAEEAADFYISVFENSRILNVTRYTEAGPGPPRTVVTVEFEPDGNRFVAVTGGPQFKFDEAVSSWSSARTRTRSTTFGRG